MPRETPECPPKSTDHMFRRRVLGGETLFGLFLDLSSPASAELCGRAGYDWLLVDLEHGAGTEADLPAMLMAIESTGAAAMVRPQSGERLRIGRALDLGATGIMVPRLESADEVARGRDVPALPAGRCARRRAPDRGAGLGTVAHADVGRSTTGRRHRPDRVGGRARGSRCDRGDRRRRRPVRRPGRPVAFARGARPVRPQDVSRGARYGHRGVQRARQVRRHPALRPAVVPSLLELGFRFVGIGADGALVSAGARRAALGRQSAPSRLLASPTRSTGGTRPARRPPGRPDSDRIASKSLSTTLGLRDPREFRPPEVARRPIARSDRPAFRARARASTQARAALSPVAPRTAPRHPRPGNRPEVDPDRRPWRPRLRKVRPVDGVVAREQRHVGEERRDLHDVGERRPAGAEHRARLSSTCVVCASIASPASSPVAGSIPTWPAVNTNCRPGFPASSAPPGAAPCPFGSPSLPSDRSPLSSIRRPCARPAGWS